MARIIFSTISGLPNQTKLPCLYEGFVNALVREGNEVLVIITNKLIRNHWSCNETNANINKGALDKKITDFNPDLVISWNNSLYENTPRLTDCPIIIYGTDSPAVFSDRDKLKNNISRYNIVVASSDFIPMVNSYFGKNYKSLDVVYFATDFVAEEIEQNKNISFIGTNFSFAADNFKKKFSNNFNDKKRKELQTFIKYFSQNLLQKPEVHLKELGLSKSLIENISHIELLNLISSNTRIQTLASIADLGLSLYGSKDWRNVADYSVDLALSYVDQEITSVKENQDIYNSSKVSINISHAQAGSAFSWRVRDIMACNSALVSDPRQDIVTQFGKYVKIPTYENPFEARQICEKLLKDEIWRKEIIAGSQLAIEEGHRFKYRMKDLEQIVGVKLFCDEPSGRVEFLNPDEFIRGSSASKAIDNLCFFIEKAHKKRPKSFFNRLSLAKDHNKRPKSFFNGLSLAKDHKKRPKPFFNGLFLAKKNKLRVYFRVGKKNIIKRIRNFC